MPNIKIIRTGRPFHEVEPTLAQLLVEAGLAEYFKPVNVSSAVVVPKENTFTITTNSLSGKPEIVFTTPLGGVTRFGGAPAQARDAFKALAWSAEAEARVMSGPEVPKHICEQYAAAVEHEQKVRQANAALIQSANSGRG